MKVGNQSQRQLYSRAGLFNFSTADILDWIIIWGGGTVLVGSVAIFLASSH